jgi:hypothetical protein
MGGHVNGGGGAVRDGRPRVERTKVVAAVGHGWQHRRPGGLGSSPYPPPFSLVHGGLDLCR